MSPKAIAALSERVTRSPDDYQPDSESQTQRAALIKDVGEPRRGRVGESEVPDSEEERYKYVISEVTQFLF